MRRGYTILTVFVLILLLSGCGQKQPSSSSLSENVQEKGKEELIQVVRQAEKLEKDMWELANKNAEAGGPLRPATTCSKEDLLHFYEQGYSTELAAQVTEYWWTTDEKGQGILRATDPTAVEPESLEVESYSQNQAVLTGPIPETYRSMWRFTETTVSYHLEKRQGRWVIVNMEFK